MVKQRVFAACVLGLVGACSPYRNESGSRVSADVWRGRAGAINAVSGTSASELFAAGSVSGAGCGGSVLAIARWDGMAWADTMVPADTGGAVAIAMVSSSEGYAIAAGCASPEPGVAYLRWNGTVWTTIGVAPAGVAGTVTRIQVLGPSSVWFASNSAFAYWNGSMIQLAPAVSGTQNLLSFAALSATDVLVRSSDPFSSATPKLRRYQGGAWSMLASPVASAEVEGLASSDNNTVLLSTAAGLYRWDGAATPTGPIAMNNKPIARLVGERDGSYFVERATCASPCADLNSAQCRSACTFATARGTASGERDWPRTPANYFRTADSRFWEWKPGAMLDLVSFE